MTITTPEVWDSYQDSGEDVLTGGISTLPDVAGSTPAWGHTQGRCEMAIEWVKYFKEGKAREGLKW